MKKGLAISALMALTLLFAFTNEVSLLSAPELFSPMGSSKPPTIPILPPVG